MRRATKSAALSSARRLALNVTSSIRFLISAGEARRLVALDRIDLDDDRVAALGFVEQGIQGRIAGVSAVPIRLAVDDHRLKQIGQARRGHGVIRGENIAAEDMAASGPHVCRRDKQLEAVGRAEAFEIDDLLEMDPQRIDVERIELVRAQNSRHGVSPRIDPARPRPKAAPGRKRLVDPFALEWRERTLRRDREPKRLQLLARGFPSAFAHPRGEYDCIHRAGARAADGGDFNSRVLGERVEHAPGVGAVRAAALERQIDGLDRSSRSRGLRGGRFRRGRSGGALHSAVHPPSIDRLAPVI